MYRGLGALCVGGLDFGSRIDSLGFESMGPA